MSSTTRPPGPTSRSPRARTLEGAAGTASGGMRAGMPDGAGDPGGGGRRGRWHGRGRGQAEPRRPGARRGGTERARSLLSALVTDVQLVVVPFVALALVVASVLVATPPQGAGGWSTAAQVTLGTWALAHGVPVTAGTTTLTIVPLGVTLLVLLVAFTLGRRTLRPTRLAFGAATGLYAVVAAVVGAVAAPGPLGAAAGFVGGLVVAGLGLGVGLTSRPDVPGVAELLDDATARLAARRGAARAPGSGPSGAVALLDGVRRGLASSVVAVLVLVAVGAVLVAVWGVSGASTLADVMRALDPGAAGGTLLGVTQLALVPNVVVWAVAWLSGAGFAVGGASHYAPSGITQGALPTVPLVAALPGPGWANTVALGVGVALVVVAGMVAGGYLWRAHAFGGGTTWGGLATSALATALGAGLLVAGLQAVAGGAVGPGLLQQVGAPAWLAGGLVAVEVGLGVVLVLAWRLLRAGRQGEPGEEPAG